MNPNDMVPKGNDRPAKEQVSQPFTLSDNDPKTDQHQTDLYQKDMVFTPTITRNQ